MAFKAKARAGIELEEAAAAGPEAVMITFAEVGKEHMALDVVDPHRSTSEAKLRFH